MNLDFSALLQWLLVLWLDVKGNEHQDGYFQKITPTDMPTCIRDKQVSFASLDNINNYAIATCPRDIIFIAPSTLPKAGLGAFVARQIVQNTYFGPYGGYKHHDWFAVGKSNYAWAVKSSAGDVRYFIDAIDPQNSNWLRFINCPNTVNQQNLVAVQYCGNIFYKAIRDIAEGEELLVYYGDSYAWYLGINATQFSKGPFHKYEERCVDEANEEDEF